MELYNFKIGFLSNFKKQIPAGKLLECIRNAKSRGTDRALLHTIKFSELGWMSQGMGDLHYSAELVSLINFIIGRQRRPVQDDDTNVAISVFAEWKECLSLWTENNGLKFSIEFNKELVEKINALIEVGNVCYPGGFLISIDVAKDSHYQVFRSDEPSAFNEDDFKYSASYSFCGEVKVCPCVFKKLTEDVLQRVKDKRLTFSWDISLKGKLRVPADHLSIKKSLYVILKGLYDSESSKDLTLVASNGAEIKCHRDVLACQSKALDEMLSAKTGANKGEAVKVEMKGSSEEGIRQFVRILYGLGVDDDIYVNSDLAAELLGLAEEFNFHDLALRAKNSIYYLNQFRLHMHNQLEFLQSMETCSNYKIELESEIKRHESSLVGILESLYDFGTMIIIVASNGAEVKCHREILISQSKYFEAMLSSVMKEAETGRIEMRLNSEEGIRQMVLFLYGFEVLENMLSPDLALELFQFSHQCQIQELFQKLNNFLSGRLVDWFTVDSLVELYFFTKKDKTFEGLNIHVLLEMAKLTEETIEGCDCFNELSEEGRKNLLLDVASIRD